MENKEFKKLLTVDEVARRLNIPLKSVYYLTETGKIKGIKIGKHWRYHSEDIENYYNNGTSNIARKHAISDNRVFPRINCNFECRYKIDIPSVKEIHSSGNARNISGSGVLLYCRPVNLENTDIGDPIELDFCITGGKGHNIYVSVSGRVVRKTEKGMGIKFRNIKEKTRNSIVNFVG